MADEAITRVINRVLVAYGLITEERIAEIEREQIAAFEDALRPAEEAGDDEVTRVLPDADTRPKAKPAGKKKGA